MIHELISPKAVFLIWRRHLKLYLQAWFVRIFTPLTEPIFYFIGFGFGMGAYIGEVQFHGQSIPYLRFVAPGMVAVSVLYQPFLEAAYGGFIRFKFSKTWDGFLSAPLKFSDIVAAELLWAVSKGLLSGITTALVAVAFGALEISEVAALIIPILIGSFLTASLGFAAASVARHVDDINISVFLILVPMFTFSGAFFPRSTLPNWLHPMVDYIPFSPVVDLCQHSIFSSVFSSGFSFGANFVLLILMPLIWSTAFVWLGYVKFYRRLYP